MKKLLLNLLGLLLSLTLHSQTPTVPSGTGTVEDPYLISSLDNLYWLSQTPSVWSFSGFTVYFLQTQDIDATDTQNWNDGSGFTPIGFSASFAQSYNGQNHKIDGLYINLPTDDYVGLFSSLVQPSGLIANLQLTNVNITGQSHVGALVGSNSKSISNCTTSGTVTGDAEVGGLAGSTEGGSNIVNSSSHIDVIGGDEVGGLVGTNSSGAVNQCSSFGSVNSDGANVGGITGSVAFGGTITNCYSRSSVTGSSEVGGISGTDGIGGTVSNCYSTGIINGESNVGMITGLLNSGSVSNSFYDATLTGVESDTYGIAKTTSELNLMSTFTDLGWDFTGEETNGVQDYWSIDVTKNDGYPYLSWQTFSESGLPVELSSFTFSNGFLNWTTKTESNNFGWDVESRETETVNSPWSKIGFISGKGTTTSEQHYSFQDNHSLSVANRQYRLKQIDTDGKFSYSNVLTVSSQVTAFSLSQNYPNPFNPSTVISFQLKIQSEVSLKIYDLLGREIKTLMSGNIEAGSHSVEFNATDLPSGMYFYKLKAGSFTETKRMMLVK